MREKLHCNYEYLILEVKANELVIKGSGGGPLVVSIETVRKKLITTVGPAILYKGRPSTAR